MNTVNVEKSFAGMEKGETLQLLDEGTQAWKVEKADGKVAFLPKTHCSLVVAQEEEQQPPPPRPTADPSQEEREILKALLANDGTLPPPPPPMSQEEQEAAAKASSEKAEASALAAAVAYDIAKLAAQRSCLEPHADPKLAEFQFRLTDLTFGKLPDSGVDHIIQAYDAEAWAPEVVEDIPGVMLEYHWDANVLEALALAYSLNEKILVTGLPGCLAGDTMIEYNRGKRTGVRPISLKDFHDRFNGFPGRYSWGRSLQTNIQSWDGDNETVKLNKVYDVWESGLKECLKITTDSGKSITCSLSHPFLTESRDFVKAGSLVVGQRLMMKGSMIPESTTGKQQRVIHRKEVCVKHHPVAGMKVVNAISNRTTGETTDYHYKRYHRSRAVVEADMNHLDYIEFLRRLNANELNGLMFLTSEQEVHHKDGNVLNDTLGNLEILSKEDHSRLHSLTENFTMEYYILESIASIESVGLVMTYDVSMTLPYDNFCASGFIVHNTGKTSGIRQFAAHIQQPYMRFNGKDGIEQSSFLGYPWATSAGMEWKDGLLPQGCKLGYLVCIDEVFKIPAGIQMAMQNLYEKDGTLMLDDKPGDYHEKLVVPAPEFRLFLTDNVRGTGDNFEKFASTQMQDTSTLDRFGLTIEQDYLPHDAEVSMLSGMYPDVQVININLLVKFAGLVRAGYKAGEISLTLSPRGLMASLNMMQSAQLPMAAALDLAFTNKLAEESEVQACTQMKMTVGGLN